MKRNLLKLFLAQIIILFGCLQAISQTTEFSYQGFLNNNNASANGNFDFEFRLYDAVSGGTLIGTNERLNVPVTNGVFSVILDFGANGFPGADRFLQISVKPAGGGNYNILSPRSRIGRTPYAISSAKADQADFAVNSQNAQSALNATQLGGVAANQFVQTNDPRLSDARNPLPNDTNYIQNRMSQQSSTNFNISGNGIVGGTLSGDIVNAGTQFNIGNNRVLSNTGTNNLFAGVNAGSSNTSGTGNSFFGRSAGNTNATGSNNTIFGNFADLGSNNLTNATAIGSRALVERNNSLVLGSVSGKNGAMFDTNIGIGTTNPNATLDIEDEKASPDITPGIRLTTYGRFNYLSFRSSRGVRSGPTSTTSDDVLLIIGAEGYNGNSFTSNGAASIYFVPTENWNTARNGTKISFYTTANGSSTPSARMTINQDGRVGIGVGIVNVSPAQLLDVAGTIRVGPNSVSYGCIEDRDGTVIAGACSSDLRFKKDITSFKSVLNNFSKLRPVNFFWRTDEFPDKRFGKSESFGLIAQEVEELFPELVETDEQGFKLVNYSKLPIYTIQAVKELKSENDELKLQIEDQKKRFESQQKQIEEQQKQLDELKKFVFQTQSANSNSQKGGKRK